jgi:hypothetical protein
MALKWDQRPAEARRQVQLLNRRFEMIAVSFDNPVQVACGFDEFRRDRIAADSKLHRSIINSESAAQNLRAGVGSVAMRANFFQTEHPARLIIAAQNMAHRRYCLCATMWERLRLMHGCRSCGKARRSRTSSRANKPHH